MSAADDDDMKNRNTRVDMARNMEAVAIFVFLSTER